MPRRAPTYEPIDAPEPAVEPFQGDDTVLSVTVSDAVARTGISRGELYKLMNAGVLPYSSKGLRSTRRICWRSLCRYVRDGWRNRKPELKVVG